MLEIKPVKSYKLPKYPQGLYYTPPENFQWNRLSTSIASTALLALLGCSCPIGVVGPPPMPPDLVTEREARTIINQAFAKNGIELEEDVPYSFISDNRTITVELDGFNEELNIGYEYISAGADGYEDDYEKVMTGLLKGSPRLISPGGFWTETTDPSAVVIMPVSLENKEYLEQEVQSFIQYLRKSGVI